MAIRSKLCLGTGVYVSSLRVGTTVPAAKLRAVTVARLRSSQRFEHVGQSVQGDAEIRPDGDGWHLHGTMCAEVFGKAVELKPDFLQGRLWLARYYAEVDSTELMKQTYEEVIKLAAEGATPNKQAAGEAYTQLGSYYFGKKNYAAAVQTFSRAAAAGVESAGLRLAWGQGIILTRGDNPDENRKKTEEAIVQFRRCVQLDPGNAQGHFWLANSLTYLRKEGDTVGNRKLVDEACAEYAKAIRLDPRNEDVKKSAERIGCK